MNEEEFCLPPLPPHPFPLQTVKLQMTCLTLKNHWLAANNITRIGSFSLDFRGSLVYSRAHSRISCEPRPGQFVQGSGTTSLCHCLAVLMGEKVWSRNSIWNSYFKLHIFFPHSPSMHHCWDLTLSWWPCKYRKAALGKLLYVPPGHFSRLKMPLCLSVGHVLQP